MTALPDDIFAEFDQRMRTLDYDQVSLSNVPGPGAGGGNLLLPDYLRDVERLNDSEELDRSQLVWESVALITEIIDAASATNQSNQPWWSTFPAERLRFKWRVLRAKIRLLQLHVANRWTAEKHRRVHEQVPVPAQVDDGVVPVPRSTPIFPTTRRDVPNASGGPPGPPQPMIGYPGLGPIAVTWDPGPIEHLDGPPSPQARDRADIAAAQGGGHGDEFFFGLGGGGSILSKLGKGGGRRGPGMDAFASNTGGPRDVTTYAHGGKLPGPKGPNPGRGKTTGSTKTTPTAKGPNPSSMASANPPAHRSTDNSDRGPAKDGPVDRSGGGSTVGPGTTGGGGGSTATGPTTLGAGPSSITVQAPPKAATAKDPGTLQINDEEADTGDPYVEEVTDDPKKGGGGSMPNPEDSGGGGEGPRSRGARLEGPNPENTGKNARNELRVPARLRFAAVPNPESRGSLSRGGDVGRPDLMTLAAQRPSDRTFLYRLPGARNYGGPDGGGGYRPADDGSGTGGGVGGPRSYDAYPDPESTGGGGPRGRYNERPNPEDTGSPHGPSARNRSAIGPWSASRNRMI